jgi:uncharacterized protein with von Willebrand factor type A (vWA) domain
MEESLKDELRRKFNVGDRPELKVGAPTYPLLDRLLQFGQAVNGAGIPVSLASVIDLCRSFDYIDIGNRDTFHAAAMSVFVSRQEDIGTFEDVFKAFWEGTERPVDAHTEEQPDEDSEQDDGGNQQQETADRQKELGPEHDQEAAAVPDEELLSYSDAALLLEKDIGKLTQLELEEARRLLRQMLKALAHTSSRRYQRSNRKGRRVDFRRVWRKSHYNGGFPLELAYRQRRLNKTRLVLLCDISGSMEKYSRFLLEFIFSLRKELSRLEVGVFSTRLTMVTDMLEGRIVSEVVAQLAASHEDWGGGTNIGACLKTFNDEIAPHGLRTGTVVIILSDGWDCGDAEVMSEEITRLRRGVHKLIWLNPLLGRDNYRPLVRGIRAAMPFIDHFLPAHNLASLQHVASILKSQKY